MGFRLRRSARLGPLRFNFSSGGLSSISVGGRGASFNIPVNRSGGPRTTVGLPGTGLSWSVEHSQDRPSAIPACPAAGLPNSRRLRPGQLDALKQSLLGVLRQQLFAPGSTGEQLWEHGLVSRLLADGSLGARMTGLLALIETPEAMESYVRSLWPDRRGPAKTDPAPADTSGIHIDLHSYSELVLWPWGDTNQPAPNGPALQTLGRKFAFFNGYAPQQSIGLYPTDGTTDDFAYGELGVPASSGPLNELIADGTVQIQPTTRRRVGSSRWPSAWRGASGHPRSGLPGLGRPSPTGDGPLRRAIAFTTLENSHGPTYCHPGGWPH